MKRKTLSQQLWAEFIGTAILIVFGDGVVANVVYATRLGPTGYNWDTVTLGWAFAVVTGIAYMVAQIVGAFVGALIVWLMYQGNFIKDGFKNVFYTAPASGYE